MDNAGFLPANIIAGETIWIAAANTVQGSDDIVFTDYTPAGGYTLSYQFAAATPITVAAAANAGNSGWTLEVTSAQTLLWKAGAIPFAGYVTHTASTRKFAVDAGSISIVASPLAVSSWAAVVTACDAALLSVATNPHGSFMTDGMQFTYRNAAELMELRSYAKSMADYETGARQKRIIRARFT